MRAMRRRTAPRKPPYPYLRTGKDPKQVNYFAPLVHARYGANAVDKLYTMYPVGLHDHRLSANASAVDLGGRGAELETRLVMRWLRGGESSDKEGEIIGAELAIAIEIGLPKQDSTNRARDVGSANKGASPDHGAADERAAVAINGYKEVLERLLTRVGQNDW